MLAHVYLLVWIKRDNGARGLMGSLCLLRARGIDLACWGRSPRLALSEQTRERQKKHRNCGTDHCHNQHVWIGKALHCDNGRCAEVALRRAEAQNDLFAFVERADEIADGERARDQEQRVENCPFAEYTEHCVEISQDCSTDH